jgi:hypothetical protein
VVKGPQVYSMGIYLAYLGSRTFLKKYGVPIPVMPGGGAKLENYHVIVF